MDRQQYEIEAQIEASHWWFVGRRRLFRKIINELKPTPSWRILDVGTSTGTNLRLLKDMGFSDAKGVDLNQEAIKFCAEKGLGEVQLGDIKNLPFDTETFDLVLATDILEHVDDDLRALRELERVMASGGKLLITVPAFTSLWGHNDNMSHHKRRYVARQILAHIEKTGLLVCRRFYFNFLLFLPIWAVRQIIRHFVSNAKPENEMTSPIFNKILTLVFSFDIMIAPHIHPPFGVSYLVVCEKK